VADEQAHTFLFADLAGFTALTEAHGDEEAADLAAEFFDCVRDLLPEYGGEEVKTIGDAVMLRCERPDAAVELGLRIVDEVRKRDHFPVVRVGMHTGPATERSNDWFGAAVNVAARVSGCRWGRGAGQRPDARGRWLLGQSRVPPPRSQAPQERERAGRGLPCGARGRADGRHGD